MRISARLVRMVRFVSLSSGSNGNCYYIGNSESSIIIDFGIGARTVKKRLSGFGIDLDAVSLILVSHDHWDHIKSLGTYVERSHKPVYGTRELFQALEHHFSASGRIRSERHILEKGQTTTVCGFSITPFEVPHDAADTVGYHICSEGHRFTFMTDIGAPTDEAVYYASMADHLIVESNYDLQMLLNGPYTPELKARIRNGHGHLANDQTAVLLQRSWHSGLQDVFLCHLSEHNNTPALATASARQALDLVGGNGVRLVALPRKEPSRLFEWD